MTIEINDINNINYELSTKTQTVSVCGATHAIEGHLSLPATIQYEDTVYPVTAIQERAFKGCIDLASITLPDSITAIGEEAFHNTLWYNSQPDGLIYLDNILYTYKGNIPLEAAIVIRPGTTCIGGAAFQFRQEIGSITIPNTVKTIGRHAFSFCRRLTSLVIPEGVTTMGIDAIASCTSLVSLTLPSTLRHIKEEPSLCDDLQTIYIPQGMTDTFCQMGLEEFRDKMVEVD